MLRQPEEPLGGLAGPTYGVTIVLLIVGQMQVMAIIEMQSLHELLGKGYRLSLAQFFVSFMTIQLYAFFYRFIVGKPLWVRLLAGIWTYQINTISIVKQIEHAPYFCLLVSAGITFLMMGVSVLYGYLSMNHRRGLFISRHNVILWSERLFVLTSFGIIVTAEMRRSVFELPIMVIYTLLSNLFVIAFGASVRRPHFFHRKYEGDYILIGQLYYLNFFALYMSYAFTLDLIIEVTHSKISNKHVIQIFS